MKLGSVPLISREPLKQIESHLHGRLISEFPDVAKQPLFYVRVPLRICPLGAHSDHQGGVVTGFTINRDVHLFGCVVDQPKAAVYSGYFDALTEVCFDKIGPKITGEWANYLRGAVTSISETGRALARGFAGVVHAEMPIGGLSSSAAVSLAYLSAIAQCSGYEISKSDLVKLVSRIENGYLGLNNGVLDQSVILFSKKDALTVIDCQSGTAVNVAQSYDTPPWEILIVYSGLSRQLTATPFNQRVSECRQAASFLLDKAKMQFSDKVRLGDVPQDVYDKFQDQLPAPLSGRARHFFSEAARVKEGQKAWESGDIARFGALVTASGNSSIVNYESGSPALISLYEILADMTEVYGARFCGGGFQGCCLALIDPRHRNKIIERLHEKYLGRHPDLASAYSIHICETGGSVVVEEFK